jgi:branched-chain amino acid transport system substrate-binding protein
MAVVVVACAFSITTVLGACGSSSTEANPTGPLSFAVFDPFSGPDAAFGPEQMAGCAPAAHLIQAAGGIFQHKTVTCTIVDTRGDPADAVPAAQKLLFSTTGLAAVIGPSSDESSATVPIFNDQQIPCFANTGQAIFDQSTLPYFWRPFPADDTNGYAMALWAYNNGYRRAAAVFGTDISSQGSAPTAISAFKALGGEVVLAQNIPLTLSSYRTEVNDLLAKKPDIIFHEADPQTSATYLSELKDIGGLVPIIGSTGTAEVPWVKSVSKALGTAAFDKYIFSTQTYSPAEGKSWETYRDAVLADAAEIAAPADQWVADGYSMGAYDSVNVVALAMLEANSVVGRDFNSHIQSVTAPSAGATKVYSFAEGKAALANHQKIQYIGATGVMDFNKYHNSNGSFEVRQYVNGIDPKQVTVFTPADLARFGS